ncbi:Putative cell envelope opacity-associated proteinA [Salmonella bongori]|nr:Putative cell envelope opacity-associated proteinA [Salmonella bongori]
MIKERDAEQEVNHARRFELKPTLAKIWHAPDNFRIMEPLPPMHRRGIIIAAIVLVIGFLLPASENQRYACRYAGGTIRSAITIPSRLTTRRFRRS